MDPEAIRRLLESALNGTTRVISSTSGSSDHVDVWMDLLIGDDVWKIAIEQRSSLGGALEEIGALQQRWTATESVIPLLAVPRLSSREREGLRDHAINHLDLSGNLWIRSPRFLVALEGTRRASTGVSHRRGQRAASHATSSSRRQNPFSKKASFVARMLLEHPTRPWRVREVAHESGLSIGYASEVLRTLVSRGYAAEGEDGVHLADAVSLLKDWVAYYRWEDSKVHSFVAPYEKDELVERVPRLLTTHGISSVLTLLAATDRISKYVDHDQVHLYVDDFTYDAQVALMQSLQAEPVPRGGNLHLIEPYYGGAVWYGAQAAEGVPSVADVQLFLDLVHYPVRGPEAAATVLRTRLTEQLGLSRSDADALRHGLGI